MGWQLGSHQSFTRNCDEFYEDKEGVDGYWEDWETFRFFKGLKIKILGVWLNIKIEGLHGDAGFLAISQHFGHSQLSILNYAGSQSFFYSSRVFVVLYRINDAPLISRTVPSINEDFRRSFEWFQSLSRLDEMLFISWRPYVFRKQFVRSSELSSLATYSPGINFMVTGKLFASKIHTIFTQSLHISANNFRNVSRRSDELKKRQFLS